VRADLPSSPAATSAAPTYAKLTIRRHGPLQQAVLTARPAGIIEANVTTTITLPEHAPWMEIEVRLDNKQPNYWPEAGSMIFAVNAARPAFRLGRLGAVVNPATDFARVSSRTYGYVNSGAMIADSDGAGVALCPLDHGLLGLGDKGVGSVDPDYVPTTAIARVSLFNNFWTTNFRYWNQGTIRSRVRVWPTAGLDAARLIAPALEARHPVLVGLADGPAGRLPAERNGLALSRPNVEVVNFARAATGEGTLLRVWEQAGVSGELTVTLPGKLTSATPVNLRGETTGQPLVIRDGKFAFNLPAYAPASFILE